MALKTFNLDEQVYGEFSAYCKKHGISMSKKIEHFIRAEVKKIGTKEPEMDPFGLDVEKRVQPQPHIQPPSAPEPKGDHPLRKYC